MGNFVDVQASFLKDVDWSAVSCPGAVLPDAANWKVPEGDGDALWCLAAKPEKCDLKWHADVRERISSPVQGRFFAYDFSMAETRTVHLRTTVEASRRNVALWVNGDKLEYKGPNQVFTARKGKNRVILRADAKVGDWFTDTVYFAVTGEDGLRSIY